MIAQEMIVEMQGLYPFGQVHSIRPDVKILVRKIVPYTKYNYTRLKDKFEIAKSIEHVNLLRLLRVLEEEGRFHLIYEYIPHPVLHSLISIETLERIKMKLIYMCVYLVECGVITFLKLDNLGIDESGEIRYYLDIDFQVAYLDQHKTHIHYIDQIDRIIEELYQQSNLTEANSTGLQKQKNNLLQNEFDKKDNITKSNRSIERRSSNRTQMTSLSSGSGQSLEKMNQQPALTSRNKPVSSTLELLNSIEKKLDQLKQNIKRHSPKHAEKGQTVSVSKLSGPPLKRTLTKTHILSRQKPVDKRKYSGDVRSMQSLVLKNIAADSVRSVRFQKKDKTLEKIRESNGEDDELRRDPPNFSLVNYTQNKKSRSHSKQHNLSRVLQNQKYNKRFLLEDDQESQQRARPSKLKAKQPQKPIVKQHQYLLSTATDLILPTDNKQIEKLSDRSKVRNEEEATSRKQKQLDLKQRISKALKKSDQAIGRYRKQSINSITTQFGKKAT